VYVSLHSTSEADEVKARCMVKETACTLCGQLSPWLSRPLAGLQLDLPQK